jgi:4-hydroxythreonine-4-phosphate dehydrogenase
MTAARKPRIAISIGDANGIGPEIAIKAAAGFDASSPAQALLVGDRFVLEHYRAALGIEKLLVDFAVADPETEIAVCDVPALPREEFSPGRVCAAAGRATIAYVTRCVDLVRSGDCAAIVGCPQNETAVHQAGIEFSGYPPLIADLTHTSRDKVFMMLSGAGLRIAHVTLHEPLHQAITRLTPDLVADGIRALDDTLKRLGISKPSIGVFGINPHAGENGLFGDDDQRITEPAVAMVKAEGIGADGPIGADVLLANRKHDAYVAMYHDQGHVPVKLISPRVASAVTIGAPVVFSSVGHGSAHDIAGKGIAHPQSVIDAFNLLASVRI